MLAHTCKGHLRAYMWNKLAYKSMKWHISVSFFIHLPKDHVLGNEHSEKRLQGARTNTWKARVKGWLLHEPTKQFAPSGVYPALSSLDNENRCTFGLQTFTGEGVWWLCIRAFDKYGYRSNIEGNGRSYGHVMETLFWRVPYIWLLLCMNSNVRYALICAYMVCSMLHPIVVYGIGRLVVS